MKSNRPSSISASPDWWLPAPAAWCAAMVAEGSAVFLLHGALQHSGRAFWAGALFCHLAAALVLMATAGVGRPGVPSQDRYRMRLVGLLVLFLPAMGLAGSLTLQLACGRWIRARGLVEDFQAETEHRVLEPEGPDVQVDLKDFLDEELAVQPVLDILAGHDDSLKRGAIDTLRRIGTLEAIHILKKCLSDGSPEVRYNAHTALTRLDESHVRRIKTARQQLDVSVGRKEDYFRYAEQCMAYGESGLLDDDTRHHYLKMARDAFVAAREKGLDEMNLFLALGHLEMALGAYPDAAARFRAVLARDPGNTKAMVGLAEVCFTSGDAEGLKMVAMQMGEAVSVGSGSVRENILLNFWASTPKALEP